MIGVLRELGDQFKAERKAKEWGEDGILAPS